MTQDLNHQSPPNLPETIQHSIKHKLKKKKLKQTGLSWLDDPYCTVKGETGLWIAVITQALVDALCKSKNPELVYCKDEAIRWLTNNNKDFVEVCLLAGLDPDYIRKKAKKAIISPTAWRAAPGFGKRYVERKIYRQKNKENRVQKVRTDVSDKSSPNSDDGPKVIHGPWSMHVPE
jgi:hypothetical protein